MNEQERKIIKLLLNEMAFEGAIKHFEEPPPEISHEFFAEIERIDFPERYDGATESYVNAEIKFDECQSIYENCYGCLRLIRNNIIHANKARRPDSPKRLAELLNWAERFIDAVYETKSPFAKRAQNIKDIMKIESV